MRRHWPKLLAGLLVIALTAVLVREFPAMVRYLKMERM
jgi:hypothetical protein